MLRPMVVLALSLLCGLSSASPTTQASISKDVNDMKYYYMPAVGRKVEIIYNNKNSLDASNIKAGVKTVVVVDGFLSDSTSPMSTLTSEKYIQAGNTNVILLDWGRLSGSGLTLGNPLATANAYISALGNVPNVGVRLAEFLEFVRVNKQISFSDMTIVGHSLGAHIAGAAGAAVKSKYNANLHRAIGLDPAGNFLGMQIPRDKRLKKGHATFVDIYHTNRGTLGDADLDTADVNVYINGGKNQPGCEEADSNGAMAGYCSHSYSWKFFNSPLNVKACPCAGESACTCLTCQYQCSNGINVGPNMSTSSKGSYHVTLGHLD